MLAHSNYHQFTCRIEPILKRYGQRKSIKENQRKQDSSASDNDPAGFMQGANALLIKALLCSDHKNVLSRAWLTRPAASNTCINRGRAKREASLSQVEHLRLLKSTYDGRLVKPTRLKASTNTLANASTGVDFSPPDELRSTYKKTAN